MLTSYFNPVVDLQGRILDAFVRKFRTVKRAITQVLTLCFDNILFFVHLSPWHWLHYYLVTKFIFFYYDIMTSHFLISLSLQLLEEGEEGKERTSLRQKLELPIQVIASLYLLLTYFLPSFPF